MKIAVAVLLSLMLGVAAAQTPSRADALARLAAGDAGERRQAVAQLAEVGAMDDAPALVAALRDRDAWVRDLAEQALRAIWERSGDADTDRLYREGVADLGRGALTAAIATFSRIIERRPQFAEGWNKRATAYFLAGDYRRSLADCDEVMRRNPYHFGALAGYGQIYLRMDRPQESLDHFRRALAVNPNMAGVRQAVEALEALLAERRRRSI